MPPWQQVSKQPTSWWPVADTLLAVNLHKSASLQAQTASAHLSEDIKMS